MKILAFIWLAVPALLQGQLGVQGSFYVGQADHRVRDAGVLVPASGAVFGGALTANVGPRFTIAAEGMSGHFTAASGASLDDHDIAQLQLIGGMKVRPWLTVQAGPLWRNVSNDLARQHWTALRVGGEARVPIGFESVRGVLRGYWMPLVSVSGLSRPDVALAASAGVEWRGRRIGLGTRYVLERYDFPVTAGNSRSEEFAALQAWVSASWSKP
ncbi:MAG TPA: hypothetical protein VG454_10740 [Gemmatimonadales bacterium]|nr:hypothetical protein [Gemmatimonadales bacterium]